MKTKVHSGAKKRMVLLPGGKIKCKHAGLRHRLKSHNSKLKRHLGKMTYVHSANMNQASRLLDF